MICPNCAAELSDDFNYCPFCEEALNKETINSNTPSLITSETNAVHSLNKKEMKDKIYEYLMKYQGSAFTSRSLINRIDEITNNSRELNTSLEAIERDLYKMVRDGMVNVEHRNGESYYVVNPDFSLKMLEEPVSVQAKDDGNMESILYRVYNFLNTHKGRSFKVEEIIDKLKHESHALDYEIGSKKNVEDALNTLAWERKISSDNLLGNKYYMIPGESSNSVQVNPSAYSSKPMKTTNYTVLSLVIISLIGVISLISGISSVFSSTSTGITFIVIGIILLGIGTKGRIFLIFLACGDCDCDC